MSPLETAIAEVEREMVFARVRVRLADEFASVAMAKYMGLVEELCDLCRARQRTMEKKP